MTSFLPNIVLSFNDCWCRRGFALDPQVVRLYGRLSQSLWNISYILDHQRFYWVAEPAACQICRLFPLHQEGLCNFLFVYFGERKSSKTLSFMLYHNLFLQGAGRCVWELYPAGGDPGHTRHSQRSLPLALPEAVQQEELPQRNTEIENVTLNNPAQYLNTFV